MNALRTKTLEYISRVLSSSEGEGPAPSWPELFDVSEEEGLSPALYMAMMKRGISIPPPFREQFAQEYLYNWRVNTSVFEELSELLPAFKCPVILLKGAALLPVVYKNCGLRGMGDVDILVREHNVPQIDKTLLSLGYQPYVELRSYPVTDYLNSLLYRKNDSSRLIHLHWHLVNSVMPNYVYRETLDMNKLWEEAVPLKVGGADALCLAPHHQLIHISEHAFKHSYQPLHTVLDIHRALHHWGEGFDWKKLCREAEEFRLNGPLFYSLWFSREFLHTRVPDEVVESLRPRRPGLAERAYFSLLRRGSRREALCWLFYLSNTHGWQKKTEFLFRTVFPPRDVLMLMKGAKDGTLFRLYCSSIANRIQGGLQLLHNRQQRD
ncbi:MAG: nucleotidyltransferase family protein [Planctomycetes bacterium]|nr:nucleotidyltransferase family protein [Planctomycetota bacterium]